jgi:hypothetical protein
MSEEIIMQVGSVVIKCPATEEFIDAIKSYLDGVLPKKCPAEYEPLPTPCKAAMTGWKE